MRIIIPENIGTFLRRRCVPSLVWNPVLIGWIGLCAVQFPVEASPPVSQRACVRETSLEMLVAFSRKESVVRGESTHQYVERIDPTVSDLLLEYFECEAHRQGFDRPCENLKDIRNNRRDPADEICKENFFFYAFVSQAVRQDDQHDFDFKRCAQWLSLPEDPPPFLGKIEHICRDLIRAYRAGYSPICSSLAYGGVLNPRYDQTDFHFQCRTRLYVPNTHSCVEIREPTWRADCIRKAKTVHALKQGNAGACSSACCRALLGDPNACREPLTRAMTGYCARTNASQP